MDEQAADVILLQQRGDDFVRQRLVRLLVLAGQVDQVRAAIGRNDGVRMGGILAEQTIAKMGIGVRCDRGVVAVGVMERKLARLGEIDGETARWQLSLGYVLILALGGVAG